MNKETINVATFRTWTKWVKILAPDILKVKLFKAYHRKIIKYPIGCPSETAPKTKYYIILGASWKSGSYQPPWTFTSAGFNPSILITKFIVVLNRQTIPIA